jgi:hypothetical protein
VRSNPPATQVEVGAYLHQLRMTVVSESIEKSPWQRAPYRFEPESGASNVHRSAIQNATFLGRGRCGWTGGASGIDRYG